MYAQDDPDRGKIITSQIKEILAAVNSSQGEYALYNRPAWARSGIGKVLYTYKQFVVITVELMRNLAPKERIIFLSALVLLSGLKGIPFADDLMDLIDILASRGASPDSVKK